MNKYIKKENLKKDPINLTYRRQITRLTWPLSILFQAVTGFKAIWLLKVWKCFWCFSSCAKIGDSVSVPIARVKWNWTCKGDVNSALGENSKEASSSTISTGASFNDDSNEETLNINNVCQK